MFENLTYMCPWQYLGSRNLSHAHNWGVQHSAIRARPLSNKEDSLSVFGMAPLFSTALN